MVEKTQATSKKFDGGGRVGSHLLRGSHGTRDEGPIVCRYLLLVVLLPKVSVAWGFEAHRRLASMMQEPLPANHCLTAWLGARQTSALQDHACDPDRDRNTDPAEAPRHYLEVDWVNPPAAYPRDWQQALADLRQNAIRNGTVPWRVEEQYAGLVAAFSARNVPLILDRAFYMSHYVTDSFSVLHNTRNYDPNDGLHNRWESDMFFPLANITAIRDQARMLYGTPGRIDPRYATFDAVLVGNGLVSQLIAADVAAGGLDAGGGGYRRSVLFLQSQELTARRWADALTVMASLLWMAWAEAGAPDLPGFTPGCARDVPTAPATLRGFPVPGGWTPTPVVPPVDAGPAVDGGSPDAGMSDGGAGGGSGTGMFGGGGSAPLLSFDAGDYSGPGPVGCQCQSSAGILVLLALAALCLRRQRHSS
jgi:MYXO-CTERM domain-containing protein